MTRAKLMFYLIATVVLLNCVNGKVKKSCSDISGYYWRDYINEIPSDAVPGGTDNKENPKYIGQTLHPPGGIVPGYINVDQQKMFYEYDGKEHSSTIDVKILCSRQAEKLQWITTQNGESAEFLALITSGHDIMGPLAIGRKIITTGEMAIGNVSIKDKKFKSFSVSNNGQAWNEYGQYEVLVYNSTVGENAFSQYVSEPYQKECSSKVVNINIY